IIKRDVLTDNVESIGYYLLNELQGLQKKFPQLIRGVRGLGFMIGIEFVTDSPVFTASEKPAGIQVVSRLHQNGLLTVPAVPAVVRLLPPLNISRSEAANAMGVIADTMVELAG